MITTFIFDFAGVVTTERCFPAIAQKISEKCGVDRETVEKRLYAIEKQYLLGKETTDEFWKKTMNGLPVPLKEFSSIFGSWYQLNEEVIGMIKKLKKKYRVILLSDNFDAMSTALRKDRRLTELFERMYFSNEFHLSKHDEHIFKKVLAEENKTAEECVFIDDKEANVKLAKKVGMRGIVFMDIPSFENKLGQVVDRDKEKPKHLNTAINF